MAIAIVKPVIAEKMYPINSSSSRLKNPSKRAGLALIPKAIMQKIALKRGTVGFLILLADIGVFTFGILHFCNLFDQFCLEKFKVGF